MRLVLLVLLVSLGQIGSARAAPRGAAQAKKLLEKGRKAYEAGRIDEAIAAWKEGLRKQALPALHCQLGRAYKEKGELEEAQAALKTCLDVLPDPPDKGLPARADVEAQLAQVAEQRRAKEAPAPAPAPAPAAPVAPAPAPAPAAAPSAAPAAVVAAPAAVSDEAADRAHGFLIGVSLGFGAGTGSPAGGYFSPGVSNVTWTSSASGGLALGLTLYGRPSRWLAIGGGLAYAQLGVKNDVNGVASELGGYYLTLNVLGLEAFPLGGRFAIDPYVRFAAGYGMWASEATVLGRPEVFRVHGLTFEVAFGAPYYVTRWLAVGPTLRIFPAWWIQECMTGDPSTPGCKAISEIPNAARDAFVKTLPALWMFGVEGQFHL